MILASASESRRKMLEAAGLTFQSRPADLDEADLIDKFINDGASFSKVAEKLAAAKARFVSDIYRQELVIGADQLLVCEGRLFQKARTSQQARETLMALKGREHRLISAAALVKDGDILDSFSCSASLFMRPLTDTQIDAYMKAAPEALYSSVGCYHYEGVGVRLFTHVTGDFHTILGLPLPKLLSSLRQWMTLEF